MLFAAFGSWNQHFGAATRALLKLEPWILPTICRLFSLGLSCGHAICSILHLEPSILLAGCNIWKLEPSLFCLPLATLGRWNPRFYMILQIRQPNSSRAPQSKSVATAFPLGSAAIFIYFSKGFKADDKHLGLYPAEPSHNCCTDFSRESRRRR